MTHKRDGSIRQSDTVHPAAVDWSLLSPQGHVLFYIALCPDCTTKNIARAIGHTERQIWSIIQSLKEGGNAPPSQERAASSLYDQFGRPAFASHVQDLSLRSLMEGAVEQVRTEAPNICGQVQA